MIDLPERLQAFIESRRDTAFAWGSHDCALFAADWVASVTGKDPADGIRGRYQTALGAGRVIKREGGLEAIADSRLGERVEPKLAQRGDVVLLDGSHGPTLGVCLGVEAAAPGEDGLMLVPMSRALACWRAECHQS